MVGDWIKWQKGLVDKPKVMQIAKALGVSQLEAAAMCMLVWEWADETTEDGFVNVPVEIVVSAIARRTGSREMYQAMLSVGWIQETGTGIVFPGFDKHNGQSAKKRALATERQRRTRVSSTDDMPSTAPA